MRAYAMGERGARNEPATPDDIAAMARLVQEAIEAGALGFSTSRTIGHRAIDGEPVPGTYAAEDELFGLGRAMAAGGQAVFELAPQGVAGEDIIAPKKELEWMQRLGAEIDRPISFGMIQVDAAPDLWREQLDVSAAAHAAGSRLYPQIAARPFGMLFGFDGHHAFTHRPTFRRLKAECGREELARPTCRSRRQGCDPRRGRSTARSNSVVRQHVCPRPVRARPHLLRWAIRPTTSRPTNAPWRRSPPNAARIRCPRCTT